MQRSQNGTKHTATKGGLSAADICRIIVACQKNNVSSIKIDEVEISFGPTRTLDHQPVVMSANVADAPHTESSVVQDEPLSSADQVSVASPTELEAVMEAELQQLMIDDPLEHEQVMIDVHLNESQGLNATYEATRSQ